VWSTILREACCGAGAAERPAVTDDPLWPHGFAVSPALFADAPTALIAIAVAATAANDNRMATHLRMPTSRVV
jgi:hypothetical protein